MASLTDMSNVAFRHTFRFAGARKLAKVECLTARLAPVARAAVVEVAATRFGITLEPVPGCAWKLLVQEGLAGAGCEGLAVSWKHGVLVDTDGRVRTWGFGEYGALGHGSSDNVEVPRVIESLAMERIICVATGYEFSMVLTATGRLFSFGNNGYGQLGLGHTNDVQNPSHVAIDGVVTTVCAGRFHAAAITVEGILFTWGAGNEGQLGHGDDSGQLGHGDN